MKSSSVGKAILLIISIFIGYKSVFASEDVVPKAIKTRIHTTISAMSQSQADVFIENLSKKIQTLLHDRRVSQKNKGILRWIKEQMILERSALTTISSASTWVVNKTATLGTPMIENITTNSAKLSWSPLSDMQYVVYFGKKSWIYEKSSAVTNDPFITINNLETNTKYYLSIVAIERTGLETKIRSNEVSLTTLPLIESNSNSTYVSDASKTTELSTGVENKWGWTRNQYYYQKDGLYYCQGMWIFGIDSATFEVWQGGIADYARDKNVVYHSWYPIVWSDPKTFEILDATYARDKNHIYAPAFVPGAIEWADPDSFRALHYMSDSIGSGYAKDKNRVYYIGIALPWADISTFMLTDREYHAKDKNRSYLWELAK